MPPLHGTPCKYVADDCLEGAVIQDETTGAVVFTDLTQKLSADEFEEISGSCPYYIPRRNEETGAFVKCDMCNDRVQNGLMPMCVTTCPTGTMQFGERQKMLDLARQRLGVVQKEFPKAQLVDEDSVSVIYLITEAPEFYSDYVMADAKPSPGPLSRKAFLAALGGPIKAAASKI